MKRLPLFQQRLQGIYRVSEHLAQVEDLATLIDDAVKLIRENFAYDHITLFLKEGEELVMRGFHAILPHEEFRFENFRRLRPDQGICGWVARHRQPALVGDVHQDPRYVEGHPAMRSELDVPIQLGETLIGVLNLASQQARAFTQEDLQLLSALADQLAVAISNLRRQAELRTRAHQQAVVTELGQHALEGIDLHALMSYAVSRVAQTLDVPYCKILELLPEGQALLLRAGVGWKKGYVGHETVDAGSDSQAGYTLLCQDPVIVEDLRAETRFRGPPLLKEHRVISGVSVIIRGQDRPFGVLGAHTTEQRAFSQDDIHFLEATANVLATAIERKQSEEALRRAEARYRDLFDHMPVGLYRTTVAGQVLEANLALVKMLRYPDLETFLKVNTADIHADPEDRKRWQALMDRAGVVRDFEVQLRCYDGTIIWAQDTAHTIRGVDGRVLHYEGAMEDITERKRAEAALRESEERYRRLLDLSPETIAVHSEGKLVYINAAGAKLLGASSPEQLLGKPVMDFVPPTYREVVKKRIAQTQNQGKLVTRVEEKLVRLDGKVIDVEVTGIPTHYLGQSATQVIIRDVTEQKHLEAQLLHLANHDPLTGLFNRRWFEEELEHHLAQSQRYGTYGALLWLDLDQFKEVNDTLGHRAGDEVLARLADLLRERLRETDILARLGGDEFAILLPHTDAERAHKRAQGILEEIRHHTFAVHGQLIRITASIGITLFPDQGAMVDELLAHADLAMYQAKEAGRNRLSVYMLVKNGVAQVESRVAWTSRIRTALEEDHFLLYAQPILDLRRNKTAQYELLLRLKEGSRITLPTPFLDVAERFGLLQDIDRWVVRKAFQTLAELQQMGHPQCLAVNISSKSFVDAEMLALMQDQLLAGSFDPGCLVLEITETAAIANVYQAQRFITTLKELGCRFALDDFGVGFSSFYHLKYLPVDYLKIDGSFIQNLARNRMDQHLVQAMVQVAQGLGKQTIAEFVEDAQTLGFLRAHGVDYAQGHFIGQPRLASEIL